MEYIRSGVREEESEGTRKDVRGELVGGVRKEAIEGAIEGVIEGAKETKKWNPRFYCCAPIGANRACCSLVFMASEWSNKNVSQLVF